MNPEQWRPYLEWNEALHRRYFSPENADQRPVYLDTDEDVLDELGAANDIGTVSNFEQAVLNTLDRGGDPSNVFYWHIELLKEWVRTGRRDTPLFVGLLAFFCLVASRMRTTEEYASNNFYLPLTKALRLGSDRKANVEKAFRSIDDFWGQLNLWLRENEGRYGYPTAFPLDHRVHVSIPLSQALLRQQDRDAFPQLFEAYDLRPGQTISRADMLRLLRDWVTQSRLSQTVKNLWRKTGVPERLADIATVELSHWDGTAAGPEGTRERRARLSLLAHYRSFPRPSVSLSLTVSESGSLDRGPYRLTEGAGNSARLALEGVGGEVKLHDGEAKGWLDLVDGELISVPDVLIGTIELQTEDGTNTLLRNPRSVVVLTADDSLAAFVEAGNIELGRDSLLLVVDRLADRVEEVLQVVARQGFLRHSSGAVNNQPEGWTLFTGVQVVGLLETEESDLAPLMPLSWTSLEVQGGIRLANRTWLISAPPEVIANAHDAKTLNLTLRADELGGVKTRAAVLTEEAVESMAILDLADLGLREGDYVAQLEDGRKVVATASVRLRSSDQPRPRPGEGWYGHDMSDRPMGAISASTACSHPRPSVSGAVVVGGVVVRSSSAQPPGDLSDKLKPWDDADEVEDFAEEKTVAVASSAQGCLTGAHHWDIDAVKTLSGYDRPHGGRCIYCAKSQRFPPRPRLSLRASKAVTTTEREQVARLLPKRGVTRGSTGADFDLLLEALSYERMGDWAAFERLARQLEDSALFAVEAMRQLVALGHLDVSLSQGEMRPVSWAVAPPALALRPDGQTAVLCGHRSPSLLSTLKTAVREFGGELIVTSPANGPTTYAITGLRPEVLSQPAGQLSSGETAVLFVGDPAREIASLLPNLSALMADAPVYTLPTRFGVQKFDPVQNRWDTADDLEGVGAYRFPTHPRTTAVFDGKVFRVAEVRLAKLWAATLAGAPAFSYSPTAHELTVRAGSELPGLYGRAAVLCSGLPPTRRSDMTSVYHAVPAEVASLLWETVTS